MTNLAKLLILEADYQTYLKRLGSWNTDMFTPYSREEWTHEYLGLDVPLIAEDEKLIADILA